MTVFERIQQRLEAYPRFRKAPGFTTVKSLLKRMDYRDTIPMIHIVGTNGKGSVASMLTEILRRHGLVTGTFTSPHLVDIRERMKVNGQIMSKEDFVEAYDVLMAHVKAHEEAGGMPPTFFELMFLLAVLHFAKSGVDVMIMEAGIGGKYDTTNVLENRWLTILTAVGLDHTEILGPTVKAIAEDKGDVIRSGITTVALDSNPEAMMVFQQLSEKRKAKLVRVPQFNGKIVERTKETIAFSLHTKYYNYERLEIFTVADYQVTNASLAVAAVHCLSKHISVNPSAVIEGLKAFRWPGRLEYLDSNTLIDGAHNEEGMSVFVEHLNTYEKDRSVALVFVAMGDKDYEAMAEQILSIDGLTDVYLPDLGLPRAVPAQTLKDYFHSKGFQSAFAVGPVEQFMNKIPKDNGRLFGYVGSLYLVSAVIKYRGGQADD